MNARKARCLPPLAYQFISTPEPRRSSRSALLAVVLSLGTGLCLPTSAWAATPAEIDQAAQRAEQLQREELQRQQQQLQRDRRPQRPPTTIEIPAAEAAPLTSAANVCLPVQRIELVGATLLKPDQVSPLLRRYEKPCVGVADIEKLLGELTALYMAEGYITARVYLPPQDLSKGQMQLQVVEGKVEKLSLEDGQRESIRFFNVLPGVVGQPLNLRDFEQGLDQINRLPSNNARFDLQPGTNAGDSIVVIRNQPGRTWHPALSFDNQGSESTGRNQLGVSLGLDRPLGVNDMLSLSYRRSQPYEQDRKASDAISASYIVPMGYASLSLNYSQSSYDSNITSQSGNLLHTSGESRNASLRTDYLAYRSQTSRAGLYGNLSSKRTDNYLEGVRITVSSRTLTVADLGANYSTAWRGLALGADMAYTRGLPILGGLEDPKGLPSYALRAEYSAYKLNANYLYPFRLAGLSLQLSSQFSGQYSTQALFGSEQVLIGNPFTVRGFQRNTLSGDSGFFVRNELSLTQKALLGSLRPYLGFDYGHVRNRLTGVPSGDLAGAALGLGYSARYLRGDVFYSRAVAQPSAMPSEGGVAYFRLSLNL